MSAVSDDVVREVIRRCQTSGVDGDLWVAVASALPHVTVRAIDAATRDRLFDALSGDVRLVVTKHYDTDCRVTAAAAVYDTESGGTEHE